MKIKRKALYDEGNSVSFCFYEFKVKEGTSEPANKLKSGAITLINTAVNCSVYSSLNC